MFISAFIFVISLAAVVQFIIQSWRSGLLRVASAAYSVQANDPAAPVYRKILETKDFREVVSYQNVFQDLAGSSSRSLSGVEVYYSLLRRVREVFNSLGLTDAVEWSMKEMALCTRYAAVVMVERLERNQALAAEVRSF